MNSYLKIHPNDNVVVLLKNHLSGDSIDLQGVKISINEDITAGNKLCIKPIANGENVIKYGYPIGHAISDISVGEKVHTHNVKTNLSDIVNYSYDKKTQASISPVKQGTFLGYKREDGSVGTQNELWIIPTVGCVNSIAKIIEQKAQGLVKGSIDGVRAFTHPYGCSQLSEDLLNTQKALSGLAKHGNAGGVLILGLGCENNNIAEFKKILGSYDENRIKFLSCQDVEDEIGEALILLNELAKNASSQKREEISLSKLIVGLKCGGSDGFSGITANPLTGRFSDMLIAQGGTTILTEVPEMFGAETILMNRCKNTEIFEKTVALINDFKEYYIKNGQSIYENPSPGNKEGGITTLEDKALGCTQKGGTSDVQDVLQYGEKVKEHGLNLLQGPGNDLVASTALAASGAHIIIFTTGRGTPFGSPVATVKVATNSELARKKSKWIDFNAGELLEEKSIDCLSNEFFEYIISVASGKTLTKTQLYNIYDMAIFKTGVTL